MKSIKYTIGLLALLATFTATATNLPQLPPFEIPSWTVSSTNKHGTLSYAIVSSRSPNGGAPVVKYLNAGSDLATASVQFYLITAEATVTYTNSTTTLFVNNTNGFSSGSDVIIIKHQNDDSYEKRILTSNTGATNLILTVAPMGVTVPGDKVYRCTTTTAEKQLAGTIFWGATTNSLNAAGAPLYVGQPGLPLLLEINATTAGLVGIVSGDYVR